MTPLWLLAAHDHDVSDLGFVEWTAIGVAALLVVWVIWRAIVLTVRPGEDDPHHIKRLILEDDPPSGTEARPDDRGAPGDRR